MAFVSGPRQVGRAVRVPRVVDADHVDADCFKPPGTAARGPGPDAVVPARV